jgi:SET domain-containing protein
MDVIRPPLGGFINFSKTPTCEFVEFDGGFTFRTIKDINLGEELTADYPLCKPE